MFGHGNPCWPAILAVEREKQVEHGDGDALLHDERCRFWKGRMIEEVLMLCRTGQDPAPKTYMRYGDKCYKLPRSGVWFGPGPRRLLTL